MAGIRGEIQGASGPKLAMVRRLTQRNTDFLVLTEVKADPRAARRIRMKHGLSVSHSSLNQQPRGGVIIISKREHKIIEESKRESIIPGHYATAVYVIR